MAGAFVAQLVTQAWVQKLLTEDAGVQTAMQAVGGAVIVPNLAPARVDSRHVTHALGGMAPGGVAKPMGGSISMVSLYWDITGWNPSLSQISMEPVMLAVMAALVMDDNGNLTGKAHLFIRGPRAFTFQADYEGPQPVPMDVAAAEVWAPVRERYHVSVSPRE